MAVAEQAPGGFPTPAEAARGVVNVPDPTPPEPEPPAKPSTPAPITAGQFVWILSA